MRDYNRENNRDQEVLEKHLKKALRELQQVSRLINGLGITHSQKKALNRDLRPIIGMLQSTKIKIPEVPVEEQKKKEVKNGNRRRKENK
tara:strand:- start:280 stop:546 length:267 start_codon:yes stop_codon:yes gene_type:complete